ncbi:hypothetical protein [Leucobacter chromiireducens]
MWLDAVLDARGLGSIDGHERGKRASDGQMVVNIFARDYRDTTRAE